MLAMLLLLPMIAAALGWALPSDKARVQVFRAAACAHLLVVLLFWQRAPQPLFGGWLALDAPGLVDLTLTSPLFARVSFYMGGYVARAEPRPLRTFIAALLMLEAAVSLVASSQHLGIFWVAIETSTLASVDRTE